MPARFERESDNRMFAMVMAIENDTDRSKVAEIYLKYYSTMLYVAKSVLNDQATAEDAVSEALIKILRNLEKITDISCYKTRCYIVIIVRNTALNILKKQTNKVSNLNDYIEDISVSDISLLDNFISEENYQTIIKAILSLPESLSDVLFLSTVNDLDNKKISKILNISYDAVKMRLSRAKKAIRKILTETGDGYGEQK